MKQSDWSQFFHADKLNNKLYLCFMVPKGSLCLQNRAAVPSHETYIFSLHLHTFRLLHQF